MKLLSNILICGLLALTSCNSTEEEVFWTPDKSPRNIYKALTDDLLSREQFMMYDTKEVKAIHYSEVCTAFGAARIAGLQNDEKIIQGLSDRYMKVFREGIINTANHVDANVYGILPLELFKYTGDSIFLAQGMELAEGQWKDPLPSGLTNQTRFWIDDVYMIGSLQIQAYRLTGNNIYLDRAAMETVAYLEKLQQANGLFFHGEEAPFYWGRGNGWVAAGLAEIISVLPVDHPDYANILVGYRKMMNSLLKYQAEDGMWRQLIDVDSAWKESSCTGMFGYAMAVGVKKGLLSEEIFKPAYQKAWLTLCDYISDDGKVSAVCVGTGQSKDIEYYLNRPTVSGDFHGQAPILWMAYSLLENK